LIRKYLSQRYPFEENKWNIIITISLFVAFFMITFQPFGLNEYQGQYKLIVLAGYGMVTFAILLIDMIALPAYFRENFREEKWTVMKELLYFLLILFTIGLGNLLYSSWYLGFRLNFSNVLIFQGFTIAIGIIPITALTIIKQSYLNRKNKERAAQITSELIHHRYENTDENLVRITSEGGKEEINLMARDLIFIKSDGNYITVDYLKNGKSTRILLRNTMKYAEELLAPFPPVYKCHRSWLINIEKIVKVTGNSQGLRLQLEGFEEDIPVARNLTGEFRQIMHEKKA